MLDSINAGENEVTRNSDDSTITETPSKDIILKDPSKAVVVSATLDTYVGQLKIGDKVNFGSYSFESYSKKQAIEWRILDIKDGKALLWSELCLDIMSYNEHFRDCCDWRNSSIREWLRDRFTCDYSSFAAFTESREKNAICSTDVEESKNSKSGRVSGKISRQKAFILSKEEIERYALSKEILAARATPYAKQEFGYRLGKRKWRQNYITGFGYWLRTPGATDVTQTVIDEDGQINEGGVDGRFADLGVRPAIWVDYKKLDKLVQKQRALNN